MPPIRIENLCVSIGEQEILDRAELELNNRETHVLRGPNASGKTSLVLTLIAETTAFATLQGEARNTDLTQEAAVGKIADEELLYLAASDLLDTEITGRPDKLLAETEKTVTMTTEHILKI